MGYKPIPKFYIGSKKSATDIAVVGTKLMKHSDYDDATDPDFIICKNTNIETRILGCKNLIETLKQEIDKEKSKLASSATTAPSKNFLHKKKCPTSNCTKTNRDFWLCSDLFGFSEDHQPTHDENLERFEEQFQKYHKALIMAQSEKKNVIMKQSLAKMRKLKLDEVENQCRTELLHIKHSLKCLESLKVMVNKWNLGNPDENRLTTEYDLMPFFLMQ